MSNSLILWRITLVQTLSRVASIIRCFLPTRVRVYSGQKLSAWEKNRCHHFAKSSLHQCVFVWKHCTAEQDQMFFFGVVINSSQRRAVVLVSLLICLRWNSKWGQEIITKRNDSLCHRTRANKHGPSELGKTIAVPTQIAHTRTYTQQTNRVFFSVYRVATHTRRPCPADPISSPLLCRLCVFSFVVRHFFSSSAVSDACAMDEKYAPLFPKPTGCPLFLPFFNSCQPGVTLFLHAITHLYRPALTVLYPTYHTHPHPVYPYWLIVQVVLKENVNISIGLGGLGDWFISTPPSCFLVQTNQERERIVVHPEPERLFECH